MAGETVGIHYSGANRPSVKNVEGRTARNMEKEGHAVWNNARWTRRVRAKSAAWTHTHTNTRARTNANMKTLESLLVFLEGAI